MSRDEYTDTDRIVIAIAGLHSALERETIAADARFEKLVATLDKMSEHLWHIVKGSAQ